MALVIETGSGVEGANSYGVTDAAATLTAARAYAADRGVTLSNDAAVVTTYLIKATDYLESFKYRGVPTSAEQPLSFPRKQLYAIDGSEFPSDKLPDSLLRALYQLCIEQSNGVVLQRTTDPKGKGFLVREKIDVIEKQYSEQVSTSLNMPAVNALLAGLILNFGGIRVERG
jgi:hypothetical protein